LGEQNLRNIAQPIHVFRVLAEPPAMSEPVLSLPDKPSLAVLPFQNMTGDVEQDYFVDGMVEEIITALSRIRWLFVIARNSSFAYRGKAVDVRQIARELGVRYVLEGSVRKAGNRVRITGQLIDTTTGSHIWAERFDGTLDDIFELQDQVASNVVGAIEPKLRFAEIERARQKPTDSLDAYDLYLRAIAEYHRWTPEGHAAAICLLRRALAIDPSYAPAAAMVAFCMHNQRLEGWRSLSSTEVADAVSLARQAIEVGKGDPDTLWMSSGTLSALAGEHDTALTGIERAVTLNPNSAYAWQARGYVLCYRKQPGPAIEAFQRAARLSPLDPFRWSFAAGIAFAHVAAGRYAEAIEWADRCLRENPRHSPLLRAKAVSYAHLGRISEARDALQCLLEFQPWLTISNLALPSLAPELIAVYVDGLRKAGMPEE